MGSFSVLNNLPSVNGVNQLTLNNLNLNRTLNRLSSGKRINTGADDAAGLQIADSLRGNVMAINQAIRNANDGISVLQIADAALGEVTSMLHRMITLAEEAANEIISTDSLAALDKEYQALQKEINRIGTDTNFNGKFLFQTNAFDKIQTGSGTLDIFVGDLSKNTYINVSLVAIYANICGVDNIKANDVASSELAKIKSTLDYVSNARGALGAGINRLQAAINVLTVTSQNTLSAEDAIRSANMAEEISNMTKYQILAQTGIAALAQANSNSQNVLGLLR